MGDQKAFFRWHNPVNIRPEDLALNVLWLGANALIIDNQRDFIIGGLTHHLPHQPPGFVVFHIQGFYDSKPDKEIG